MTARTARIASDTLKGLKRAVAIAPHPAMKRLGELALLRGFSQEELARRLNDRFNLHLNGSNVYGHITTPRPQLETIRRYSVVLALDREYRLLLPPGALGEKLAGAQRRAVPADLDAYWLNQLALTFQSDEWKEGTDVAVTEHLRSLPASQRRSLLGRIALEHYREVHGPTPGLASRALGDAFEKTAPPELKLAKWRQERVPGDTRFRDLWYALQDVFDLDEFELVLAVVRTMHEQRYIDVSPMDRVLNEDFLYRKRREERPPSKERLKSER